MKPLKRSVRLDGVVPSALEGAEREVPHAVLVDAVAELEACCAAFDRGEAVPVERWRAVARALGVPEDAPDSPHGPEPISELPGWQDLGRVTLDYAPAAGGDVPQALLGLAYDRIERREPLHRRAAWNTLIWASRMILPGDVRSPLMSRLRDKPKPAEAVCCGWTAWAQSPPMLAEVMAVGDEGVTLRPLWWGGPRWLPPGPVQLRHTGSVWGDVAPGCMVFVPLMTVQGAWTGPGAFVFPQVPNEAWLTGLWWRATLPWRAWRPEMDRADALRGGTPRVLRALHEQALAAALG